MRTTLDADTYKLVRLGKYHRGDYGYAWATMLSDVINGTLWVDARGPDEHELKSPTLLHLAAAFSTAGMVQALLKLGASPRARDSTNASPMHYVLGCETGGYTPEAYGDMVAKAKLLPAEDLACEARCFGTGTPLHVLLTATSGRLSLTQEALFDWMLEQPQCDLEAVNHEGRTPLDCCLKVRYPVMRTVQKLKNAITARRRWTAARAAWIAAAVAVTIV